jgi:hypothetical protein
LNLMRALLSSTFMKQFAGLATSSWLRLFFDWRRGGWPCVPAAHCRDSDSLQKATFGGHELDKQFCVALGDYLGLVWQHDAVTRGVLVPGELATAVRLVTQRRITLASDSFGVAATTRWWQLTSVRKLLWAVVWDGGFGRNPCSAC